jgi:signal transduction histidine kinase
MKMENAGKGSSQIRNLSAEKLLAAVIDQHKVSTLGTLVKGIVHNVNGSLQILSMRMELLQRRLVREQGEIDPGIREQVDQCLEQIDQFRGVIEILMRKAAHDELDGSQLVQLDEVFEENLALLYHNLFFKHQVQVLKKYSSALPPFRASYSDLSLGIWNLLQNAIEAMENSPTKVLTVGTDTDGKQIRLTIQDTGCGIPEEIRSRLFEPFFSTKKGKHCGMGLFLTQRLLEPYGASFDFLSQGGETAFTVYLPTSVGRGN